MKKIFGLALAGLTLLTAVSCSDSSFNSKYEDPSKTSTVGVPQVFTGILYKGNNWMNPAYYRYYVQSTTSGFYSGVIGNANSRGRFRGASEGYYNTRWQNFYDMLTQYRLLEDNYNKLEEAQQPSNKIFLLLGRTIMQAQLHEMLSIWGDVPYTGASTIWKTSNYADAKAKDVFDSDVETYKTILKDLKEVGDYFAAGNLNATGLASLKRQDFTVADGKADIWQRYVNSLRLRIALHLATHGECVSDAKAAIKEILENPSTYPLIDDNSQNQGVAADTQTDEFNYGKSVSQALSGNGNSSGSQTMLDAMNVGANSYPNANTDPRLPLIYDPNPMGRYVAYDVSKSSTEISDLATDSIKVYQSLGIKSANYYCVIDSQAVQGWATYQGNEHLTFSWINAAEVSLSKAECYLNGYGVAANATKAKECFVQGVAQSFEYYKNLKTKSTLYKAVDATHFNDSYGGKRVTKLPTETQAIAYANSIWDGSEKVVATQLWLNFSFTNELEAWNVVRRTGFPKVTFATDAQASSYPTPAHRLPYTSDELTYNAENVQAVIAKKYKEPTGYYTKLFWANPQDYYNMVTSH